MWHALFRKIAAVRRSLYSCFPFKGKLNLASLNTRKYSEGDRLISQGEKKKWPPSNFPDNISVVNVKTDMGVKVKAGWLQYRSSICVCLSFCLFIYLYVYLSVYLFVCLFICLSIYLLLYFFVCLSMSLSLYVGYS